MPEDDATSTTTDATTITTTDTTADSAGTTPPAKLFTQEDMNRIAAKSREEGRRSVKQEPTKRDDKPASDSDLRAELEEMKLRNAFDKRVAKLDLRAEAEEDLFVLFKAQRPTDLDAWVKAKAEFFGPKAATVTTQPSTTTTTPPASSSTQPAKVETSTVNGGLIDLWGLSIEQLTAMGPQGIREAHEKVIAHGTRSSGAPPLPKVMTRK